MRQTFIPPTNLPVGLLRGHYYLLLLTTRLDVTRLVLSLVGFVTASWLAWLVRGYANEFVRSASTNPEHLRRPGQI